MNYSLYNNSENTPAPVTPGHETGKPYSKKSLEFRQTYQDRVTSHTTGGDSYLIKAQQTNGHVAYCSPIWFL